MSRPAETHTGAPTEPALAAAVRGGWRGAAPLLVVFLLYALLRAFVWGRTVVVEDHDSMGYLLWIETFLTWDLRQIVDLSPDATPVYPFLGALFSLPGWSLETGARLASFVFSLALFAAVWGIGRRIAGRTAVAIGLLMLSFSAVLIPLSIGILTEPSYIATIYLGLWGFWSQYRRPNLWMAALLGAGFSLAFLNRIEGLLFLAFIPAMQAAHYLFSANRAYSTGRLVRWCLLFVTAFSLLAAPQIWRVSDQMGALSINGRQVWNLIEQGPDDRPYQQKLRGLDHSPTQINFQYLQQNPEARADLSASMDLPQRVRHLVGTFDELYRQTLGTLIGPVGVALFAFGLVALYRRGQRYELFLLASFLAVSVAAPLLHNAAVRHLAIIIPIMLLVAGVGTVEVARQIAGDRGGHVRRWLPFALLAVWLAASAPALRGALLPPNTHAEYSPEALEEPARIIREVAIAEGLNPPAVSSSRVYLPYLAGFASAREQLPFTDLDGLRTYLHFHDVDLLFLEHGVNGNFPFMEAFRDGEPAGFPRLYHGADHYGNTLELYRVAPSSSGPLSHELR